MTIALAPAFLKIFVGDLDRSVAFYRDCLGFVEAQRMAARDFDEIVMRPGGEKKGASLVLCRWKDGRTLDLGNAHGPFGFFVEDVDATFAAITGAGGSTHIAPVDFGRSRLAVARDPDGHPIELLQRPAREQAVAAA